MTVSAFLAGLPALLGAAGFVVYQLLQHSARPNPILADIVSKLRREAPERVPDKRLTASQVERLLRKDSRLRHTVTDQDFVLLQKVLNQQFWTSLIVYAICAALFVFGVVAYLREVKQTRITGITLQSDDPQADGLPVDLDPLTVEWKAEGDSQPVRVYLENVQANTRSKTYTVSSGDRKVRFCRNDYRNLLINQTRGGRNRVRVVIESVDRAFSSPEFELAVGILLNLVATAEKTTLAATIDNKLVQGYDYEARVLLHKAGSTEVSSLGGQIRGGKAEWRVPDPTSVEWAATKIAYLGPDDPRTIRTALLIDREVGFAPSAPSAGCTD